MVIKMEKVLTRIFRGKVMKRFLQFMLQIANSTIGMVGIAMILYSRWMNRAWHKNDTPCPWIIHAFLGGGLAVSAVSFLGLIAAYTAKAFVLYIYMFAIILLLMGEIGGVAYMSVNPNWEKELPQDPSGMFDDFKNFVTMNSDFCKWIGVWIIAAQGLSFLLAIVLRLFKKLHLTDYESDGDYDPPKLPLLNPNSQTVPYGVGYPHEFISSDEKTAK